MFVIIILAVDSSLRVHGGICHQTHFHVTLLLFFYIFLILRFFLFYFYIHNFYSLLYGVWNSLEKRSKNSWKGLDVYFTFRNRKDCLCLEILFRLKICCHLRQYKCWLNLLWIALCSWTELKTLHASFCSLYFKVPNAFHAPFMGAIYRG